MEAIRRRVAREYRAELELFALKPSAAAAEFKVVPKSASSSQEETTHEGDDVSPAISSRDWTLQGLLRRGKRFKQVKRIPASWPEAQLLSAIEQHEQSGEPLIIEGWHQQRNWPRDLFDINWLLRNCGDQTWQVRNVRNCADKEVKLADFIKWSRERIRSGSTDGELLYGKDAPCPPAWRDWVNSAGLLPPALCPNGPSDLLQHLTETEAVESLMCYLGVGDTLTPCHKDLCGSSGQNIMCYTEDGGSSFWFMTSSSDAPSASEYFQKHIGQELDWEAHTVTVEEFANAPFTVFVTEQKLGDLVLVPPRSCHQVVNHGGLTVKTSWSRMTLQGLAIALHHELPIYRRVCRPEQYRVKYILYRSLLRRAAQIKAISTHTPDISMPSSPPRPERPLQSFEAYRRAQPSLQAEADPALLSKLANDLAQLIDLFDPVLYDEYTPAHRTLDTRFTSVSQQTRSGRAELTNVFAVRSPMKRQAKPSLRATASQHMDEPEATGNFACDFCGADIFQGFFECVECQPIHSEVLDSDRLEEYGDGLLICPPCYAEGRTCGCERMAPRQCRPFRDLLQDRNNAVTVLASIKSPAAQRFKPLMEKDFETSGELKIFEAGCQLLRLRTKLTESRKCRCGYSGPQYEVFSCKKCHSSKCMKDLLKGGIYAAEAVLGYTDGDARWHELHRIGRKNYQGNISHLQDAERSGEIIDRKDRLVFVAQRYASCRPLNPENTRLGWYDEPLSKFPMDISEAAVERSHSSVPPPSISARGPMSATGSGREAQPSKRSPSAAGANEDASRLETPPSPLTEIEVSPAVSPHTAVQPLPQPLVRPPKMRVSVEVTTRRPTPGSAGPSSSQSAARNKRSFSTASGSAHDLSEEGDHAQQHWAQGLVEVFNNAHAKNMPAASGSTVRVAGRRILSDSPEPVAITESSASASTKPPPPKKRRIAKSKESPIPGLTHRITHERPQAGSQPSAVRHVVVGARGQPPGLRAAPSPANEPGPSKSIAPPNPRTPTPPLVAQAPPASEDAHLQKALPVAVFEGPEHLGSIIDDYLSKTARNMNLRMSQLEQTFQLRATALEEENVRQRERLAAQENELAVLREFKDNAMAKIDDMAAQVDQAMKDTEARMHQLERMREAAESGKPVLQEEWLRDVVSKCVTESHKQWMRHMSAFDPLPPSEELFNTIKRNESNSVPDSPSHAAGPSNSQDHHPPPRPRSRESVSRNSPWLGERYEPSPEVRDRDPFPRSDARAPEPPVRNAPPPQSNDSRPPPMFTLAQLSPPPRIPFSSFLDRPTPPWDPSYAGATSGRRWDERAPPNPPPPRTPRSDWASRPPPPPPPPSGRPTYATPGPFPRSQSYADSRPPEHDSDYRAASTSREFGRNAPYSRDRSLYHREEPPSPLQQRSGEQGADGPPRSTPGSYSGRPSGPNTGQHRGPPRFGPPRTPLPGLRDRL